MTSPHTKLEIKTSQDINLGVEDCMVGKSLTDDATALEEYANKQWVSLVSLESHLKNKLDRIRDNFENQARLEPAWPAEKMRYAAAAIEAVRDELLGELKK